jgi:biopolymer transport protein ExbB
MKRILLFFLFCFYLQACKKSKSDAPPPTPIAAYYFDNDWLTNSISSLLHGNQVGNVASTTDSFDIPYRALSFFGNGYVEVKDSDLIDFVGNQFSLAAWIKPSKTQVAYIIVKTNGGFNYTPYGLTIYPEFASAYIHTTTDEQFQVDGKTPTVNGAWQHIAVTFNGEQLTIYYNGKSEGTVLVDRPLANNKGDLNIGGNVDYFPSAVFEGRIDNVKIYDKALTAGEINYLAKNYNH